ncbi:MAG: HAD hydrolase family protein, partial [Deltaproteobacteria bacterium]|nr:HAD hydrolase family protein [Deltaproteobacteria bacterium]
MAIGCKYVSFRRKPESSVFSKRSATWMPDQVRHDERALDSQVMAHIDKELLMTKAHNIRLLALDVDGVLTDGSIVYTSQGEQVQGFHVHDGLGLKLLGLAGIHVAILSSRSSRALTIRAEELGIKLVYQGLPDKIEVYERIKKNLGIEDKEVACIGDDWVDLPLLQKAGLAIVVA